MRIKFHLLVITIILFLITACKKGRGAVCNDGTESSSTGRGTCSWHGGVDHYIDPNEISVSSTIGLIVILVVVGYFIISTFSQKK